MKTWKRTELKKGIVLLSACLFLCSPAYSEEIRVGLIHAQEAEIRCDGPFQAIVDGGSGGSIDLQPGIYTLRAVETSSFFRAAPLVAGLVSAPAGAELSLVSAIIPPAKTYTLELLQTPSQKTAEQAAGDARKLIGGKVGIVERDGAHWVQMGPYPNQYLANQALQKARQLGFPAQLKATEVEGLWERAGVSVRAPKQIRRLISEGETNLEVPPDSAIATPENLDLAPLEPLPDDAFDLEPLPTFAPEDLEVTLPEPLPETEESRLGPDLGWVPAPAPKNQARQPASPLRRPPQRVPYSVKGGPNSGERRLPPPPGRFQPGPRGPRYAQGQPPAPAPARPVPIQTPEPELKLMPQPGPKDQAAPIPTPALRPPSPAPQGPPPSYERLLQEPVAPPPVAQAPSIQEGPSRSQAPYVFHDRTRTPGFRERLKNFPIIRRFWWEDPLVESVKPPVGDREPAESVAEALQQPAPLTYQEPPTTEIELPGVPPTPLPFDPDTAKSQWSEAETLVEPEPFPTTVRESLPAESPSSPGSLDDLEDLLPSGPETDSSQDPLLVESEPQWVETTPDETVITAPESGTPKTAEPLSSDKRIALPVIGPVRGGFVQLFDDSGKPVTDPVTVIDLRPATSSHLEFANHSFHGSFQAYAPGEDSLVLVNKVDIEDYLTGLVPQEIPPDAPLEVLKAQAVMSRCYAVLLAQRGDYADFGYDIPGTPDSEWPYQGRELETPVVRQAIRETAGEVLVDEQGQVATPVYCFSSGGYVADGASVWAGTGEPVPSYLKARPDFDPTKVKFELGPEGFSKDEKLLERWLTSSPDTYDKASAGDSFRWTKNLSNSEMDDLINAYWNNQVGKVKSISITGRAISGHATRMVVEGDKQTVTARDADSIRQALQLDSSLIVIKDRFGPGWDIYGGGFGHGVGLSQCGAIGLVESQPANYRQVLFFYFDELKPGRRALVRSSRGA